MKTFVFRHRSLNKNETPAAVINVVKFRILISDVSYASQQPFSKVF